MAKLNGEDFFIFGTDLSLLADHLIQQLRERGETYLILELTVAEAEALRAERESFEPRLIGALWTQAEQWDCTDMLSGKRLEYDQMERVLVSSKRGQTAGGR